MLAPEPILFCWSGGKDSAMALHTLLQQQQFRVVALLTTVTEGYDRISMHGVRRELLLQQAESIGLPLREVRIPPQCVNPIYESRMERALRIFYEQGVRKVAFGDIFLEDIRAYREKNLARIGMAAPSPLASIPKFSLPVSPAANLTILFSMICRWAPTPAAKTANFTLLSLMVPSSAGPFPFGPVKLSIATASSFAIYFPNCKELQNESRRVSERKSALPLVAGDRKSV